MINDKISVALPAPWTGGSFEIETVGPINYLVGPNGSGKSRFAANLLTGLKRRPNGARLLSTDRLREMAHPGAFGRYWGDNFGSGYGKNSFNQLREAGADGSGIDTILLLEERMDLRIRIEATLSHLFGRDIVLEWDSGNLVPYATWRDGGQLYRLDRDECHGIKELLVLLTHLYDDQHDYLIIDEPELNLHPQYQAYFMEEVRRVAWTSGDSPFKKIVFLITHSPFILDLRREDDIRSIIAFDLQYSVPKQVGTTISVEATAVLATGRLNAHHKQLFFSDNPVFVEGHHDSVMLEALMEARGVSAAAAGSCIIDCGGVGEVNHYLNLCQGLGKVAHFVYDLDSMFQGRLRSCIGDDDSIGSILAASGVGTDFTKYVGELDQRLTEFIDLLLEESLSDELVSLTKLLANFGADRKTWNKEQLAKARVAILTVLDRNRNEIISTIPPHIVEDIEGRWKTILNILTDKNIHVLPGGSIECYLPSFSGDLLDPKPEAKSNAVDAELRELQRICESDEDNRETALTNRYRALYEIVKLLPSKPRVDFDEVLRRHLSDYVHELQKVVVTNPAWTHERIETHMSDHPLRKSNIITHQSFHRDAEGRFEARITISEIQGEGRRFVDVCSDTTIGNMPAIRPVHAPSETT